ncbi:hypothetical protein OPV22_024482 [Ensete ventricosum]|uniref:Uncharacterized protein n=1 Tax=Ensete ventricosum TaxID=4639 RepID=A0AAV8QA54_ENSVE|nr:hypothetical protein OPV22_024482 [Ensete ventricosum]
MGRAPGSGLGGRLLEWWSSGRGEMFQLGSAADSCKKRRRGFYSNSNGVSVPEALIFFIAYHTVAPHHAIRGPCGEACACSWGMSTLPPLPLLDRIDLGDLRGMPKMSDGKAPSTRTAAPAWEVGVSPAREAPKVSSKKLIDAPTEQVDDPARRHKKVKVLTRRHKS